MAITRWDPMAQIERMQSELDRMFGRVETAVGPRPSGKWMPEVDVEQTEGATVYRFDLPGLKSDQVKVGVHDHLLTISGERREEHEEKHEGYLRQERSIGRFERSMQLPADIKDEDIGASFADGVLTVKVPRTAQAQPREIPVTAE
jgi:HSP20 family protein